MSEAQVISTASGAILIDAMQAAQVEERWFEPAHWRVHGALAVSGSGRGSSWFIDLPRGACVLRHYRRGGLVARVLGDRYLWSGAERTRSFAEWRLLAHMRERGLPVPAPVAARFVRTGWYYRADLITARLANSQTLAERLLRGHVDAGLMQRVGSTIADFHAAGIFHADLNAHNVMVNETSIHLLDFDRGERRAPNDVWREANLARLHRSLRKLVAQVVGAVALVETLWAPLRQSYTARLGFLAGQGESSS